MAIKISGPQGGGSGGATTLNGLTDVSISSVQNSQVIQYNSTSGDWENSDLNITGGLTYKGTWNATTGAPSLANAEQGDFYLIDTAGTIYGQTWAINDHLLINADMGGSITNSKIDKIDNTDQVVSVNGQTGAVTGLLEASNNLSDVSNAGTARTNLGLGTAATSAASDFLAVSNNLSDVANAGTARTNLGLGTAAVETVGTAANNVVQLDGSSRLPAVDGSQLTNLPSAPVTSVNGATGAVTGLLEASNNLSDVANAGTARTNLGLGTAAVETVGTAANNVVQLDGSSRLPAVDGSQLTNLPSAPVTSVNGATGAVTGLLEASNNLSDVANAGTARTNLGLGTAAVETVGTAANNVVQLDGSSRLPAVDGSQLTNLPSAPVTSVNGATGAVTGLLEASNNLSDVSNAGTARTNLGLGTAATSAASDFLTVANNLSDLNSAATARTNLGLGTAATSAASDFLADVADDTSPQLGGDLDIQGQKVTTSTSNGSIGLEPDGTGSVVARGTGAGNTPGTLTLNCEQNSHGVALQSPAHSAAASYTLKLPTGVGTSGQALTTDGNTPAQLSWATVGGGGSRPTVTTDSSGTNSTISDPAASTLEDIYLVDNGSNAVTIILPTVTGNSGYKVQVKRLGTANVTVQRAGTATIDDGAAITAVLSLQYGSFTLITDGTDWFII